MKKFISLMLLLCVFTMTAYSKNITSGDEALDESLNSLTEQVKDNPDDFIKTNLAVRFNQPFDKLINLLKKDKFEVSEIFIISYLSASLNKDLDSVIKEFASNKGNLSKFLEIYKIKKGTKEYKKFLKASINIHPKPFIPKVK